MIDHKNKLLKECIETLKSPKVGVWYENNMFSQSQAKTIDALIIGVEKGEISIREAFSICLIVGVQWNKKFEGVP